MPVTSYSRTPASNNSAPPNGAPEGMTPGSVNNTLRQLMTDTVNEASKGAAKVLGTVAGTNTITAVMSPSLDAYSAGMTVVLTPAATNTGAVTLNINTLGALDIQKADGDALAPGDLVIGIPALLVLDAGADDFILVNPCGDSSFTGTLTGYGSNPTGTVQCLIRNGHCTLYAADEIAGTSNASTMTMTGVPAHARPSGTRQVICSGMRDNGLSNFNVGHASVAANGVITFALLDAAATIQGTFTASGSKGLAAGWFITYPL